LLRLTVSIVAFNNHRRSAREVEKGIKKRERGKKK